jgi:dienelactone hydrolase
MLRSENRTRPAATPIATRAACGLLALLLFAQQSGAQATKEIAFTSHDGHAMRGRLTMPAGAGPFPVVVYAQTAEGMTIDVRRQRSATTTFNYFDLYADSLPSMGIAFFRYDGRGVGVGDAPPRYETIDTAVFNTSTLDNKVRDLVSAVAVVRSQPGIDPRRVILMGASEGTLLIADAATRARDQVAALVMYAVLADNLKQTARFMFGDGAFLMFQRAFDADTNGIVSRAEFEADPRGFRARGMGNAPFAAVDLNRDSVFSVADLKVRTQQYLDAVDQNDFGVLHQWSLTGAAVALPKGWFADHFAYRDMWSFLSTLDIPVGIFHGDMDAMTPIGGVRALEAKASAAGKSKMRFQYFRGADHSLGLGGYFARGTWPAGHTAIFAYLREIALAR